MKTLYPLGYVLLLFATACHDGPRHREIDVVGKKPVYADEIAWTTISVKPARAAQSIGKIVTYNQFIFLVDNGLGVHVINNADPANPQKMAFLSIPMCTDIAIKDNLLYANNGIDMVILNISNPTQAQLIQRMEGVYNKSSEHSPAVYTGYFECVDESRGRLIGWTDTLLHNPECRK